MIKFNVPNIRIFCKLNRAKKLLRPLIKLGKMDIPLKIFFCMLFSTKWVLPSTVSRFDSHIEFFQTSELFIVESTALLSEHDKDVGFRVQATLKVQPVWKDSVNEYLLKFNLQSPALLSKGKGVEYLARTSIWDSLANTEFYAHWRNGMVLGAYLDSTEPMDVLNFKKSLISLFQLNVFESENNETDISGACEVRYEIVSMNEMRKTKNNCTWGESGPNTVVSQRTTLYKLDEALDNINEIYAEELHTLDDESVKAHAWVRVRREPAGSGPPQLESGTLSDVVQRLLANHQELTLTMQPSPKDVVKQLSAEELNALLEREAEALGGAEAGEGGTARVAAAVLRVLPALAAASRATLSSLLHKNMEPERLSGLCRLLGLAGTAAAHRAAEQVLQLRHGDASLALAHIYFEGFALAPEPEERVVTEVLQLGEELAARDVAESALLAAAAACARLPPAAAAPRALRDALARSLARCKDDECRAMRLRALGNLRRADTAELLLEHAERGGDAALAALDALAAVPPHALTAPRLQRLQHLALAPRPLELRAAALDLLLRHVDPHPPALLSALRTAPAELRRLMWARLDALADEEPRWRAALSQLAPRERGWDARAAPGTSALLAREAGASGGWRARLESVQLTRAGLLRRARVTLTTFVPSGAADDTLAVELWARGLQSLAGGEEPDEADGAEPEDEAVSGGLAFTVGGARTRSLSLFESQGELLGHVWAGTGSEPTPVLRALRPLSSVRVMLPLFGAGPLRLTRHAAVALAMDAQAQVSLWSRNARTSLSLRGAVVSETEAQVGGACTLRARTHRAAEPRLHIAADVDFYGSTAMCVRVSTDPFERIHNSSLESAVGGAMRGLRRTARWAGPGRTLSLGALNDLTCNTLGAL